MTTHTLHPDSHEFGLADDCLRCKEHVERPWLTLDDENIGRLTRRILTNESGMSGNETEAMANLERAMHDHYQQKIVHMSGRISNQSYYRGPSRTPY